MARVTVTVLTAGLSGASTATPAEDPRSRLRAMRVEIERLRAELGGLQRKERGVLGDLERLGAELRLREAELGEASLRLEAIGADIEKRNRELERLEEAQGRRRVYLAFRLREIHKRGPVSGLRRLAGGEDLESYLQGLRYAAYLTERDGRILEAYRSDSERLRAEREALLEEKDRLAATQREAERARAGVSRSRLARTRLLERIRADQRRRRDALRELEAASEELSRLVHRVAPGRPGPSLDVRKFQGLLDWPAIGRVSAAFGNVVHPRFKTVVPHPGLDIDAPEGSDVRSVFDGTVAYAAWLHGYGLTVIVDHGGGLVSIYAHASVITVEEGEGVARGQSLGKVGDTGSLRGPYLYFELREEGAPVDPELWLRRR